MMTGMPPPPIGGPPSHSCPPPPGDIETDRKIFFERLTAFNEERGYSNNTSPTISKQPLDLHLLYNTVRGRGGFIEVSRQKLWKECASICNLTINSSAAYTLKKQYIKHLLPFECKFDRGDADVNIVISQSEAATKSNSKKAQAEAARAAKSGGGRDGSAPSPGPGGADSNSQGSISSASTSSYGTGGDRDSSSASRSTPGPQQHPPPPLPSPGVIDGSSAPRMDSPYGPPRIPSHPPGVPPYHHAGYNTSQPPPPPPPHHPYGPPPPHHLQGPPPMTGHHPGYGGYGPPPPPHHQQSQHPGYGHAPPPHHDQSIGGWPQHHQPPAPPHSGYGPLPPHSMPSGPQQHRPYPGPPPQGGESITAQDPFSDEAQQHQQQPSHPGHSGYGQPPPPPVNGYSGQQQYRHPAPTPTGQYSQQPPPPRGYPDYRQQPQPDNRAYGPQQGPPPSQPPQQPGDQSSSQSRYPPSQPAPPRPSPTTTPQPGSGPPGPVTSQQQPPSSTTPSSHSPYPPSHQPPPHYTSGGKPAASQQHYPPPASSTSPYGPPQQLPTSAAFVPSPSNQGMMRYPRPPGPPPPPTSSSEQQQPHQQMPPPPPPPPVSSQSPSSDQSQSSHYPQGPPLHHHPTSGGKPAAAPVHPSYPISTSYATSHSSYPGQYGQGYLTPASTAQHPGYGPPPPPPHHDQSSWSQQHAQQPGYGPPTPGHQTMPPPPPPGHHRAAPHSQTPPSSGAVGQSGETVSAQDPFGDDNQQGQSSNSSVPPPPTSYGQPPPRPVNGYPGQQYSSQPPPGHPSTMIPPSNVYNQSRSYGDYRDTTRPPFGGHLPPPSDQSRYPPPGHGGGPPRAAPPIVANQGHPSHGPPPHHPYPHSGGKPAAYGGQPSPYGQHHPPQGPPQHASMFGPRDPSGMRYQRPPHPGHGGPPPHHLPSVGPSGHPLPYQSPGVGSGAGFHPSVGGGIGPGGPALASILKKEMTFPPGSVEATQPVFVKRRRVTSRDISQIEAWRLLMCLKSGLLAESTWALDVLSVLAYDDSTTNCFVLSGMPGLLDTILEHFKKYLGLMFSGIFEKDQGDLPLGQEQKKIVIGDTVRETGNSSRSSSPTCQRFKIGRTNNRPVRKWYQIDEDVDDVKENSQPPLSVGEKFVVNGELSNLTVTEKEISPPAKSLKAQNLLQTLLPLYSVDSKEGRLVLLNGSVNYSMKTRDGKSVKIVNCKSGFTSGDIESRWNKLLWSTTTTCNPPSLPGKNSGKKSSNDGKVANSGGHSSPSGGKNNNASRKSKGLPSSVPNQVVAKQGIDCVVDGRAQEDWNATCHILTTFAPKEKIIRFVRLTEPSFHKWKEMERQGDDLTSSPSPTVTKVSDLNGAKLVNGINKETGEKGQDIGHVDKIDVAVTQETYPRLLSKRKRQHDLFDHLEEEAFHKDHPPLYPIDDYLEQLGKRCLALSTLLRNFSFVPQNEPEMARHQDLLMVLSRLMLLNHHHPPKVAVYQESKETKNTSDPDSLFNQDPPSPDLANDLTKTTEEVQDPQDEDFGGGKDEWYWETMHLLLENTLVTLANISGQLDVSPFPEEISLPLLDGLLHWAVCPSSYARDRLPLTSLVNLSPQRLALETLVKLSIRDCNVDLILATPPWERLHLLFKNLTKMLARNEDQTLREFSLVLLVNLTLADSAMARAVALTGNAIPQLISFIEQSEQSALSVAQTHGINALRENPELMGTTLDMVRRAAICLRTISRITENRPLFHIYQQRILNLVMSQILDQGVAAILADVMYECSLSDATLTATKQVFLPYINVFATSGNLFTTSNPPETETTVAPMQQAESTNSSSSTVVQVKGEPVPSQSFPPPTADHHVMSTPQQHTEEAPIVNGTIVTPSITDSSNADEKEGNLLLETHSPSSQPSSQQSISPLATPIKQSPSQQAVEEDVQEKMVVVNGMDGPKLNHQINNGTRGSSVPPVVQGQPSNCNNSAVEQQPPNNNDPSRGCPRLKELLLSYQMSPKFDGQNSSSSGGHEQPTEQIS